MSVCEVLAPGDGALHGAAEALARSGRVRDSRVRERELAFYDTFDGRLHRAGVTLVYEGSHLSLVERATGLIRARMQADVAAKPLFARQLEAGPLRDALLEAASGRALLPLGAARSRERPLDVLDDEAKTVARVALCEAGSLQPRIRVTGVRGYDRAFERVRQVLTSELGFPEAEEPLVDEAVRAGGGVPGGVSSKVEVPLWTGARTDRAAVAVLRRLLEVMEANLDGTIADIDTEFLHDFRVALRRSRSVQRELRRAFEPASLARLRGEFRWLQQVTGDSRDLDVYVLEFERFSGMVAVAVRADLGPVLAVLQARRLEARGRMVRALRSQRAQSLLREWAELLAGLESSDEVKRPAAALPIGSVAGRRIRAVYRGMRRMGEAIDDSSPAEAYHELRKKGKELRYLLELFGASLYPAEVVTPMLRSLKALQDVLGRHQDREIQIGVLHSLASEVVAQPGGTAALMAMGALVQRLGEDELAARAGFAERFATFSSRSQRKLVAETFR